MGSAVQIAAPVVEFASTDDKLGQDFHCAGLTGYQVMLTCVVPCVQLAVCLTCRNWICRHGLQLVLLAGVVAAGVFAFRTFAERQQSANNKK